MTMITVRVATPFRQIFDDAAPLFNPDDFVGNAYSKKLWSPNTIISFPAGTWNVLESFGGHSGIMRCVERIDYNPDAPVLPDLLSLNLV